MSLVEEEVRARILILRGALKGVSWSRSSGTQFTCFTSTNVQMLTLEGAKGPLWGGGFATGRLEARAGWRAEKAAKNINDDVSSVARPGADAHPRGEGVCGMLGYADLC